MKKIAALLTAVTALLSLVPEALSSEIIGPESVPAGELAVFEAPVPGAWAIWPACGIAQDSAGDKVYFASRIETEFTLIFCHVVDGKPVIVTRNFVNGVSPAPKPEPEPEPEPKPEPKPELTREEKETLKWALESVLEHVDAGRLRTPQGVRATFKNAVSARISTVSDALSETLDDWTERTDFTSMQTVKSSFETFMKELEVTHAF